MRVMALLSRRLLSASIWLFALCAFTFSSSRTSALEQIFVEEEADTWPLASVLELTQHNFSEAVEKHEYLLVSFYAPWCEHCRKLAIELDIAAPLLALGNPSVTVAKVDSDKNSAISGEHHISRLPTLKLFVSGKPAHYSGPLEANLLVPAVLRLLAPPVIALTSDDEVRAYVADKKGGVLGVFVGIGLAPEQLEAVASNFLDKAWFAAVPTFSEQLMVDLDFGKGPALLATHSSGETEVYYGPFEGKDLFRFVSLNYLPPVVLLTDSTFTQVTTTGRPVVLLAADFDHQAPLNLGLDVPQPEAGDSPAGEAVRFTRRVKPVARRHRDKLFAYIDGARYGKFLESFHVNVSTDLPCFLVWNGGNEYYTVGSRGALQHKNPEALRGEDMEFALTRFLQDVDAKKYRVKYTRRRSLRESIVQITSAPNFPLLLGVIAIALAVTYFKKGPSIVPSMSGRGLESVKEKLMEERRQREAKAVTNEGEGQEAEEVKESLEDKEEEEKKND